MERKERRVLTNDEMLDVIGKMQFLIPPCPGFQAYAICVEVLAGIIVKTAITTSDAVLDNIADDVKMRIKRYFEIVKEVDNEQE